MPKPANITAKEFAMSTGSEQESSERDSDDSSVLEPHQVVQKILAKETGSLFEKRVQAIAFLAEVTWIVDDHDSEESNPPLTGAEFRRTARGVFSPQIREAMGEIDHIYSRVAYIQGNRTRKFETSNVTDPAEEEESGEGAKSDAYRVVNDAVSLADNFSDETLMSMCLTMDDVESMETGETIDLKHVSENI
jgi:hypothetical protein